MNHVPDRGPGLRFERAVHDGNIGSHKRQAHSRSDHSIRLRSLIIAACFLATFIAYVERTGFSVAYTAAAKEHAVSEAVKGTVLSSFFWGYAVSQASVPGACVSGW
jgi:sugar phosphate permease